MISTISRRRTLAMLVSGAAFSAAPAFAAKPLAGESSSGAVNLDKVTARLLVEAMASGHTQVVRRVVDPTYIDHVNPGTGRRELIDSVRAQAQAYPQACTRVYRVVAEGPLVFVHSNLILERNTLGYAVMDVFLFSDGRVVEHWGGRQEVPAVTVSGNDMFSTLSSPVRLSPDHGCDVEVTKNTMNGLFTTLMVDKDLTAWEQWAELPYYQHSVNTDNGFDSVREVWGVKLIDPATTVEFVNSVAEGDLFVSQSKLYGPGLNVLAFDISRVRNGKVVEHWDVVQPL